MRGRQTDGHEYLQIERLTDRNTYTGREGGGERGGEKVKRFA